MSGLTCAYGTGMRRSLWLRHDSGMAHDVPGHPERPARIRALEGEMSAHGWFGCSRLEAPAASRELLPLVHPEAYVAEVGELCASGRGAIQAHTYPVPGTLTA